MEQVFASIKEYAELILPPFIFCALAIWIWREARAIRSDYVNSDQMPDEMKRLWGKFRRAGFTEDALYMAMMTGFVFVFFYSIKFATEHARRGMFAAELLTDIAVVGMAFTLISALFICVFYSIRRFIEKRNLEDEPVAWTPPRVSVFFSAVFAPFGLVAALREILHETPDAVRLVHHWINYF
jgi:hypothetical protein